MSEDRRKVGIIEAADELVTMKALSVCQPWASYICDWKSVLNKYQSVQLFRHYCEAIHASAPCNGPKTIETRTWWTPYRGDLVICATKAKYSAMRSNLPNGCALGIVRLADCRRMKKADEAEAKCPWRKDLSAWVLEDIRTFVRPFPVRGRQRIFEIQATRRQLEVAQL